MAAEKVGVFAGARADFAKAVRDIGCLQGLHNGLGAGGLFGMPEPGVVFLVGGVGDENGFHG